MHIIAIDPGTTHSAYLLCDGCGNIHQKQIMDNEALTHLLKHIEYNVVAIEAITSYGMPVGQSVFVTCIWIGRFIQVCVDRKKKYQLISRLAVKMHLCHDSRAKDGNIRQAIIDRYPATGGGKCPQIGTKKEKGPLFGISKDLWSALALALTYQETQKKEK